MMAVQPSIISIGTAVPPFVLEQEESGRLIEEHFKGDLTPRSIDVLRKVFTHPSVRRRHISVGSIDELGALKNEDPDRRVERFTKWAVDLSKRALRQAIDKAGMIIDDISAVIVNTCTGYICPGIATYLFEQLDMKKDTPVYDLVGSGCGGAVPNIHLADKIVRSDPSAVVACISVEISSATFEMDNDIGLIVSNALFGDGAAAAIVAGSAKGLSIGPGASAFFPESRDYVRFEYRHGRLHNRLDPQLPKAIRGTVPPFLNKLLEKKGLRAGDVSYWALHPGGDKILTAIQEELKLTDEKMLPARRILENYGNMSSPTVLFVLQRMMDLGMDNNTWCMMAAYGAGMSIHGCLLKNGEMGRWGDGES